MENTRDSKREVWRKLFSFVENLGEGYSEIDATFKIHDKRLKEVIITNIKYKFRPASLKNQKIEIK